MHYVFHYLLPLSLPLAHSLTPPTVLDSIKQRMVIKRNVSAFIKNSSEYRRAHCAHWVLWSILELFDCRITWQSPALRPSVFNLLLPPSHFMAFTLDRLCCIRGEGNSFSQPVGHSFTRTVPYCHCPPPPPPPTHYFSFALGDGHSWPDIQAGLCLREPHAAGR